MHSTPSSPRSFRLLNGVMQRRLFEVIAHLQDYDGDVHGFPLHASRVLTEFLESHIVSFTEMGESVINHVRHEETPLPSYEARLERYVAYCQTPECHRLFRLIPQFYGDRALRNNDFFTDRQFRELTIYHEAFPSDLKPRMMAFCFEQEAWWMSMTMVRYEGRGYSDSDQQLIEALRPHFIRSYDAARMRTLERMTTLERIQWLYPTLGPRQREVLQELAEGRSYEEIGRKLHISIDTVKTHLKAVFQCLEISNRSEAIKAIYSPQKLHISTGNTEGKVLI